MDIFVSYNSINGRITFDGLTTLRFSEKMVEMISIPFSNSQEPQPIRLLRDPNQEQMWTFKSISFMGADGWKSWRTVTTARERIFNTPMGKLAIGEFSDGLIEILDTNHNTGFEHIAIQFQTTIQLVDSGHLFTSFDPQIINEKDNDAP